MQELKNYKQFYFLILRIIEYNTTDTNIAETKIILLVFDEIHLAFFNVLRNNYYKLL